VTDYGSMYDIKRRLRKKFPKITSLETMSLIDCIHKIYPYDKKYFEVNTYSGNIVPTKRAIRLFETYLWVMREYHELLDL